jgi:hypothetical protein
VKSYDTSCAGSMKINRKNVLLKAKEKVTEWQGSHATQWFSVYPQVERQ